MTKAITMKAIVTPKPVRFRLVVLAGKRKEPSAKHARVSARLSDNNEMELTDRGTVSEGIDNSLRNGSLLGRMRDCKSGIRRRHVYQTNDSATH